MRWFQGKIQARSEGANSRRGRGYNYRNYSGCQMSKRSHNFTREVKTVQRAQRLSRERGKIEKIKKTVRALFATRNKREKKKQRERKKKRTRERERDRETDMLLLNLLFRTHLCLFGSLSFSLLDFPLTFSSHFSSFAFSSRCTRPLFVVVHLTR